MYNDTSIVLSGVPEQEAVVRLYAISKQPSLLVGENALSVLFGSLPVGESGCMVAVTNLMSKHTILYGMIITLVVTIQCVSRRWTASNSCKAQTGMHGRQACLSGPCNHPKYSIL